ncbi:UDP-N-acetylmuramoylalanyl-D-glutamate--2, 6-diaminopimelate ligase OS=Lysinibacillus sphaericus OX=1421 GN=LS41612_13690 PE=4 SV=1 [Lysinibacillus sphaericus]
MQNIRVTVVRKLLQGDLVSGSEQWFIKHAIYYNRHDLTQKNTLMFINRSETINWEEIDKRTIPRYFR